MIDNLSFAYLWIGGNNSFYTRKFIESFESQINLSFGGFIRNAHDTGL